MTTRVGKGIFSGFIATVALSVLMIIKTSTGMMPEMNAIKMLSVMAHGNIGTPLTPVIGWVLHFIIGSLLWGILFGLLYERLPSHIPAVKGLIFASAAWILMMIMVMPMVGAGFFGFNLGLGAPVATLVLHWAYGIVLGAMYGKLNSAPRLIASHNRVQKL